MAYFLICFTLLAFVSAQGTNPPGDWQPSSVAPQFDWRSKDSYLDWIRNAGQTIKDDFDSGVAQFEGMFDANGLVLFHTRVPITESWQLFTYNLLTALFKFQPRLSANCFNEGATLFSSFWKLFLKFVKSGSLHGQEEFNFEDSALFLLQKCNLLDTLPATLLLNFLINRIDDLPEHVRGYFDIPRLVLRLLDVNGFVNSFVEIGYSISLVMARFSLAQDGKLVGKAIKLVVQLYMFNTFGSLLKWA